MASNSRNSCCPARELKYLLRAYDSKGNFDETDARPLRCIASYRLGAS